MTQRNLITLLIITAVTVLSCLLILPTVGNNEMMVRLTDDAAADKIDIIKKRFPSPRYALSVDGKEIHISGYGLNNAVLNELSKKADYPFVKEAKILPHWTEDYLMAKRINLGLDLQGGSMLVLQADFEKMSQKMNRQLSAKDKIDITNQALDIIRNRVDAFGVSEPQVRTRGNEQVELQLPGIGDPKAIKELLGATGRVEYRLVDDELSMKAKNFMEAQKMLMPADWEEADMFRKKINEGIKCPADKEVLFYYENDVTTGKTHPTYPLVVETKVAVAGNDIATAVQGTDEYGRIAVHFTTTAEGAQKFAEATAPKNKGRRLAIVIDDKIRSAPSINSTINTGKAIIEGSFSQVEIENLVRIIKEGALPVDLRIVEERTVGATLGQDSIRAGVIAGIIALIAITVFMLLYYRMAGFIAIIGLVLNSVYALALLSWAGFTLTLPGLAGFVLTLGVAVDANVIIYERIREELRNGRTVSAAITMGFEHAFWTIFDSNLTTVLAALILTIVGTGPIKGYAVTLTIGIIANMFVALYVTKFIYVLIASRKNIKKLSI
jgi:preprotein translocase subunit SecD